MPSELEGLLPECLLLVLFLVLGLARLVPGLRTLHAGWTVLPLLVGLLALTLLSPDRSESLLSAGLFRSDSLTRFCRVYLLALAGLTILLTGLTGRVRTEESVPVCALILVSTLGLMLTAAAAQPPALLLGLGPAVVAGYLLTRLGPEPGTPGPEIVGFLATGGAAAAVAVLGRFALANGGTSPQAELLPAVLAGLFCTLGHLAGLTEKNAQRLLLYATLGQFGYLMMGLAIRTPEGVSASLVGLVALLLGNLGAFGVLAFLRQRYGSTDLRDWRGLIRRAPLLTILLTLFLLSLLGVPPLLGGLARFQLFAALAQAAQIPGTSQAWLLGLLFVAGLNLLLASVLYLSVLRVLILEPRAEDLEGSEIPAVPEPRAGLAFAGAVALLVVGLMFHLDPILAAGQAGAEGTVHPSITGRE